MKFLAVACFVVAFVTMLQGASADCKHPGVAGTIKDGDKFSVIGTCMQMTCQGGGFSGVGCGMMQPRRGCRMSGEDNTKLFPDCCPKEIC